uniref:Large ribosomal subunit protein mL37 n=1 Tax=Corethrella appendiculata TaxID=1370023 RepID=U5EPB1_9DIPT
MRLTQQLYRQHIGRMFKKHWVVQGQRTPIISKAFEHLKSKNIEIIDANEEFSRIKFPRIDIDFNSLGQVEPAVKFDSTHPNWHEKQCHLFGDSNVLVEGTRQTQVLTNTIAFNELPAHIEQQIEEADIPVDLDKSMRKSVLASFVFDTEQVKLEIVKDPLRPAWNFPRTYGISKDRRNRLIISRLINHCERLVSRSILNERKIIQNAFFVLPLVKDENLIQLELHADTFMTSSRPLKPVTEDRMKDSLLPNIFPLKDTITIPMQNIYEIRDIYPIKSGIKFSNPHTIFLHFGTDTVKNLHETPITDEQFEGRSLIKAFTVAATKARQQFGPNIKDLPEPIVVQSIQTTGKSFHFGIFQLNTLDLTSESGVKNVWFHKKQMNLFTECEYQVAKPVLNGYNKNVLRHFYVFYKNS